MLKTFSLTDIGRKRQMNQDYVFLSETSVGSLPDLFIVADGMGGYKGGDFASKFTTEAIVKYIKDSSETDTRELIRGAISFANKELRKIAFNDEKLFGMGTTVVLAVVFDDNRLLAANVGDSRLYVINDKITQITRDHSLVQEMVRAGSIDEKTARQSSKKNIITRAVGASEDVKVDFFELKLHEGDSILMCSDGLTNMLENDDILTIVLGQRDIVEKVEKLVWAANENGGKDNISVILVEP